MLVAKDHAFSKTISQENKKGPYGPFFFAFAQMFGIMHTKR